MVTTKHTKLPHSTRVLENKRQWVTVLTVTNNEVSLHTMASGVSALSHWRSSNTSTGTPPQPASTSGSTGTLTGTTSPTATKRSRAKWRAMLHE